jgi:hypothetical protein
VIRPVAALGDAFRGGYRLPQPRVVHEELDRIAADADARLEWHGSFSAT